MLVRTRFNRHCVSNVLNDEINFIFNPFLSMVTEMQTVLFFVDKTSERFTVFSSRNIIELMIE